MPRRSSPKPKLPTHYQAGVLRQIARSRLIKTHIATKLEPVWTIDGTGVEISNQCAQALIRNGWIKPNRDGLSMFDESQTYSARVP